MKKHLDDGTRKIGAGSWWSLDMTHHGNVGHNPLNVKRRPYLDGIVLVRRHRGNPETIRRNREARKLRAAVIEQFEIRQRMHAGACPDA